jgi:hypothetical protein
MLKYFTLVIVVAAAALCLVGAAAVAGPAIRLPGAIVYVCGNENSALCRVAPDGTRRETLQRSPGSYFESPSISLDGRRLAVVVGGEAYLGDGAAAHLVKTPPAQASRVSLRPDGKLALLLTIVRPCARQPCSSYGYTGTIFDSQNGQARDRPSYVSDADWLSKDHLIAIAREPDGVLLTLPASGCCGRVFLSDPRWIFLGISVSPSGETIAVSAKLRSGSGAYVLLISRRSKEVLFLRPVRQQPPFPYHYAPQWSPDGRWLVMVELRPGQDRGLLVVARAIPNAAISRIGVAGSSPTWGSELK